jgi:hypothetical protein
MKGEVLKGGERSKAARRREMRLSSLHVRGINEGGRQQSPSDEDRRPTYEDDKNASYIKWSLNSFQNAHDITYHKLFCLPSFLVSYLSLSSRRI